MTTVLRVQVRLTMIRQIDIEVDPDSGLSDSKMNQMILDRAAHEYGDFNQIDIEEVQITWRRDE